MEDDEALSRDQALRLAVKIAARIVITYKELARRRPFAAAQMYPMGTPRPTSQAWRANFRDLTLPVSRGTRCEGRCSYMLQNLGAELSELDRAVRRL